MRADADPPPIRPMSNRTAQCAECVAVFEVESTTGRLPTRCPQCREGESERASAAPAKPARSPKAKRAVASKAKRKSTGATATKASDVKRTLAYLNSKLVELDEQREILQAAVDALEAVR